MIDFKHRIIIDHDEWKSLTKEELEKEGSIEGFFQICVNSKTYGYYHDKVLQNGEEGFDLISTWYENLLKGVHLLYDKTHIAIKDIETEKMWISLAREANSIRVQVVESSYSAVDAITLDEVSHSSTCVWEESEDFCIFVDQLLRRAREFLHELTLINTSFRLTNSFQTIERLIGAIETME